MVAELLSCQSTAKRGDVMALEVSAISLDTANIVSKVEEAEISPQQGIQSLLKIALKCETVHDLDFVGKARESIEKIEKNNLANQRLR